MPRMNRPPLIAVENPLWICGREEVVDCCAGGASGVVAVAVAVDDTVGAFGFGWS